MELGRAREVENQSVLSKVGTSMLLSQTMAAAEAEGDDDDEEDEEERSPCFFRFSFLEAGFFVEPTISTRHPADDDAPIPIRPAAPPPPPPSPPSGSTKGPESVNKDRPLLVFVFVRTGKTT